MLISEILSVLAYLLVATFLESMVIVTGLLLIAMILPSNWFLDEFIHRSTLVSIFILGYLIYFATRFTTMERYPVDAVNVLPYALVGILIFSLAFGSIPQLRRGTEIIADQTIIFLYIYLPLTAISLILILVRVLF